ncbi:MAG: DUF6498-containing protein, partial [Spirochaetia bacterium]|nr:DUF6498-containing protein [Spirochaetia bacterium]
NLFYKKIISVLIKFFFFFFPFQEIKDKPVLSVIFILAANLSVIPGIFFLDWNPYYIMFFFWLETFIMIFFNLLMMTISDGFDRKGHFIGSYGAWFGYFLFALFYSLFIDFPMSLIILLCIPLLYFREFPVEDLFWSLNDYKKIQLLISPEAFLKDHFLDFLTGYPMFLMAIFFIVHFHAFYFYFIKTEKYRTTSSSDYSGYLVYRTFKLTMVVFAVFMVSLYFDFLRENGGIFTVSLLAFVNSYQDFMFHFKERKKRRKENWKNIK